MPFSSSLLEWIASNSYAISFISKLVIFSVIVILYIIYQDIIFYTSDSDAGAWEPVVDESTNKYILVSFPASKKAGSTTENQPHFSQDRHQLILVKQVECKVSQ